MATPEEVTHFVKKYEKEFSIKGNRPVYTCDTCKKTQERRPGDFETAQCARGHTMHVHFVKD